MKLKDLTKQFFSDLPLKVKKGDAVVIEKVTADELALNAEYKYVREMEVFHVYVHQHYVTIILK